MTLCSIDIAYFCSVYIAVPLWSSFLFAISWLWYLTTLCHLPRLCQANVARWGGDISGTRGQRQDGCRDGRQTAEHALSVTCSHLDDRGFDIEATKLSPCSFKTRGIHVHGDQTTTATDVVAAAGQTKSMSSVGGIGTLAWQHLVEHPLLLFLLHYYLL